MLIDIMTNPATGMVLAMLTVLSTLTITFFILTR